jgi:REP element-mobilizing transposase RayT
MVDLYQQRYRIPSVRLQAWDYRSNAAYFVTICTKNMIRHFGHITDGAVMEYSLLGETAFQFWNEISKRNPNVFLDAFVIMPNHVHGIIITNTTATNTTATAKK